MGKIIKIIILGIIALAFLCSIGCRSKKAAESTTHKVKDSISVIEKTIVRDSLVFTKVDSASIMAMVICPDGTPVNLAPVTYKSKNARVTLEIKNGLAKADCFCDSVGIIQRTKETIKAVFKQHLNNLSKITTRSEPYVPLFFKIMSAIGGLASIYLIYKLIKFFK